MPPLYRVAEVALYSVFNFLPFLVLAIYPFRRSLRFSVKITGLFIGIITVIQLVLGAYVVFAPHNSPAAASAVSTVMYAVFYFLTVKQPFGKTLFTLLMLSNIANFAVICAKCFEGLLFPELAVQDYRWSASLTLVSVELLLAVPVFFYMKKVYTPAVEKEGSGAEWKYLWLIPATFYLIWYYIFYGNTVLSSLEIALLPKNTAILFVINVGEILVYYIITKLISEQEKTLKLKENNYRLEMQAVRYENLGEKIVEARRAKHDVRHHIALMREYAEKEDYAALKRYLDEYGGSISDDSLSSFCRNTAANAVLSYFAEQAKNENIAYTVKTDIPENIGISDTDISVLFGNLVENATDACKKVKNGEKKIDIRANVSGNSLCITVDNSYAETLKYSSDGTLLSTKHEGEGLGTQSVKSIAERYGGVCRFEAKDGIFYASVFCHFSDK